jgi:hypothetical protein
MRREEGFRIHYERQAPQPGKVLAKTGEGPSKAVWQVNKDVAGWQYAEDSPHGKAGEPLNLEFVAHGKHGSGMAHATAVGLPVEEQERLARKAVRTQENLKGQGRDPTDISYGEMQPTLMDFVSGKLSDPAWTFRAVNPGQDIQTEHLEDYRGMIVPESERESELGPQFTRVDLQATMFVPPSGVGMQVYGETGVNRPSMNLETLRQLERGDPATHRRVVAAGEQGRTDYQQFARAYMASMDPSYRGSGIVDVNKEIAGRTEAGQQAITALAEVKALGLGRAETAAKFMREAAPEWMRNTQMLIRGGAGEEQSEAVLAPLQSWGRFAASGAFPNEAVTSMELRGFQLAEAAIEGETGLGQSKRIQEFLGPKGVGQLVNSARFGRNVTGVELPLSGEDTAIAAFGDVMTGHGKIAGDEFYSPTMRQGGLGYVAGQPTQHGGKTYRPELRMQGLTEKEIVRRGLDPGHTYVGSTAVQMHGKDWDGDLIYGMMMVGAKWQEDQQAWVMADGSTPDVNEIRMLAGEALLSGAGEVSSDLIQGKRKEDGTFIRPQTVAEDAAWYKKNKMSGYREVPVAEIAQGMHARSQLSGAIGHYYQTYRRGMAMTQSETEIQAVEAFHSRSHGFAQRPAFLHNWMQTVQDAMSWTEKSGQYRRGQLDVDEKRVGVAGKAPAKGVTGLLQTLQRGFISAAINPLTKEERASGMKEAAMTPEHVSTLIAPAGMRSKFAKELSAAGPEDVGKMVKRLGKLVPEREQRLETVAGKLGVGRLVYSMRREQVREKDTNALLDYRLRTEDQFMQSLEGLGLVSKEGDISKAGRERQIQDASALYRMGEMQEYYKQGHAKDLPVWPSEEDPGKLSQVQVGQYMAEAVAAGVGGPEIEAMAKTFGFALPTDFEAGKAERGLFPGLAPAGSELGEQVQNLGKKGLIEAAVEEGEFGGERKPGWIDEVRRRVGEAYADRKSYVTPSALNWGGEGGLLMQESANILSRLTQGDEKTRLISKDELARMIPPTSEAGRGSAIHALGQEMSKTATFIKPVKGAEGFLMKPTEPGGKATEQVLSTKFAGVGISGQLDVPWGTEIGGKPWGALDIKPVKGLMTDPTTGREMTATQREELIREQMAKGEGDTGRIKGQMSAYHWAGRAAGLKDLPSGIIPYPKELRDDPKRAVEQMFKWLKESGPVDVTKQLLSKEKTEEHVGKLEKLRVKHQTRIQDIAVGLMTGAIQLGDSKNFPAQIAQFQGFAQAGDYEQAFNAAAEMGIPAENIHAVLPDLMGMGGGATPPGGSTGSGGRGTGSTGAGRFTTGGTGGGAGRGEVERMAPDATARFRLGNVIEKLGQYKGVDLAGMAAGIRERGLRPTGAQRRAEGKLRNTLYEAQELTQGLSHWNTPAGMAEMGESAMEPKDVRAFTDLYSRASKMTEGMWDTGLIQAVQGEELGATLREAEAQSKPFVKTGMLQFMAEKLGKEGLQGIPGVTRRMAGSIIADPRMSELAKQEWGTRSKGRESIPRLESLAAYAREKGPGMVLGEAQGMLKSLGKGWTGSEKDFAGLQDNLQKATKVLGAIGGLDADDLAGKGEAFKEELVGAQKALKQMIKQASVVAPGAQEFMAGKGAAQLAELEASAKKGALRPTQMKQLQGLESMAYMGMAPGADPAEDPRLQRIKGLSDQQRVRAAEAAVAGERMPGQPDRRGFQDMGLAGAAAGTVHRFMSGWELMRLRRMWGMTGQPVFDQFIPAAAQFQMGNWQMATQAAGYGGPPTGAAGGMMELQAGKQRATIEAGQIGYDAWGWAAPMMQGFQKGQAAWGPAVGAGLVGGALASTVGMTTGMGAAAAATTIGLPVSAAIAGTLGVYAAGQYAMAGVDPTISNMAALAEQPGGAAAGRFGAGARLDWQQLEATREFLGLPEAEPQVDKNARRRGKTGPTAQWLSGQESVIEETRQAMIQKYEELRGTPMADMEARFRTGMLGDTVQNLAEMGGTAYPMLDPKQIQAAVGELMPYMKDTTQEGIEKYMQSDFAQQVAVTGVGPEAMRPVAEQLRMGRDFRMKMAQRISPMGAAQQEDLMTAMGQWAPLQRFGYTADEIFQSVMPDETGGRPLYGRADMESALLGGTATRKKLVGQEAIAQEEALAATGMYAQAMGKPLTSPEVQEFWKEMEPLIYIEDGRFQIQNAALVIQPAAQASQMTGRPEDEIMAEFVQALGAGQTVQGLYMMNQIEQGQGPLQAAAGIPAGFTTGLGQRSYDWMQAGMKSTTMAAIGGAIGFGRTQLGYSMMAGGWGAGPRLNTLFEEAGMPVPEAGMQGFYGPDFAPINQAKMLDIQEDIRTRTEQHQRFGMDIAYERLHHPVYGANAQLQREYATQMGRYEDPGLGMATVSTWGAPPGEGDFDVAVPGGGTPATGLLGQLGLHREMIQFTGMMRDVNNRMRALSRQQQMDSIAAQEQGVLLGFQQGKQKLGLARRRFAEDVRHQEAMMSLQSEQMVTTQQWQREDIAWGRETAGLQYEYQMDELGRSIRLSGGQEKQQLLRKREYMEEMYGREETKRNVDAERAETRMGWERTRFDLERQHFDARKQLQMTEFNMQRRHMQENFNMQMGNIGRQKEAQIQMWLLEDEQRAINEAMEDRRNEVNEERILEQISNAEIGLAQAEQELAWKEEERAEAEAYFIFVKEEEQKLRDLEQEARIEQAAFLKTLTEQWSEGGDLYTAIMNLIDAIRGVTPEPEPEPEDEDTNQAWPIEEEQPYIRPEPKPVTSDSVLLVVDDKVAFKAHLESVYSGARQTRQQSGGWGELWQ